MFERIFTGRTTSTMLAKIFEILNVLTIPQPVSSRFCVGGYKVDARRSQALHIGRPLPTVCDGANQAGSVGPFHLKPISAAEGRAVDKHGNIYGAEVGPGRLVKHVKLAICVRGTAR